MNSKPQKSIDIDNLLQDLDEKVEEARKDCDKVISKAVEYLKRKEFGDKK